MRIDFACNVIVQKTPNQYLDILASPQNYKMRTYEGETKYFENARQVLCFYDKTAEMKAKHNQEGFFSEDNILRYEVRLIKDVANALGWRDAKLENIYNYGGYMDLLNRFYSAYKGLPAYTLPMPSQLDYSHGWKEVKDSIFMEGIRSLGGSEKMLSAVKQTDMKRELKFYIRKFINLLPPGEVISPLLKNELDAKITAVCKQEAYNAYKWSD